MCCGRSVTGYWDCVAATASWRSWCSLTPMNDRRAVSLQCMSLALVLCTSGLPCWWHTRSAEPAPGHRPAKVVVCEASCGHDEVAVPRRRSALSLTRARISHLSAPMAKADICDRYGEAVWLACARTEPPSFSCSRLSGSNSSMLVDRTAV